MYVKGPRYEYRLFNQSKAKLCGWINLNNLTVLHSYFYKSSGIHRVGDCQPNYHHGQLTPSTLACVAGAKRARGRGRGEGGEGERKGKGRGGGGEGEEGEREGRGGGQKRAKS